MPTASQVRTGPFLRPADTDFEIDLTHDGPDDGPPNMRRDEALLSRAENGRPGGRVYSWHGLWVSLGFGQAAQSSLIDPEATRWARRPTGGGAVLHGHDVTIAMAIPLRRSVRQSYRLATLPLIDALGALGFGVALAEDVGPEKGSSWDGSSHDCFAEVSKNDIVRVDTGLKVCGCALKRTRRAVLLQASIPIAPPLADPARTIVGGVSVAPLDIRATELSEVLGVALRGILRERIASH